MGGWFIPSCSSTHDGSSGWRWLREDEGIGVFCMIFYHGLWSSKFNYFNVEVGLINFQGQIQSFTAAFRLRPLIIFEMEGFLGLIQGIDFQQNRIKIIAFT